MNSKNKKLIGICTAVIVVIAVIIIAVVASKSKKDDSMDTTQIVEVTNSKGEVVTAGDGSAVTKVVYGDVEQPSNDPFEGVEIVEETTKDKDAKKEAAGADKKSDKKSDKKNGKNKEEATEADALYATKKNGEIKTKKNGEKVTRKESYPGEADGWSPMVKPEDLEK